MNDAVAAGGYLSRLNRLARFGLEPFIHGAIALRGVFSGLVRWRPGATGDRVNPPPYSTA